MCYLRTKLLKTSVSPGCQFWVLFPLNSWFFFLCCCWVNENVFKYSPLTLSARGTLLNVFPFPLKLQHLKSVLSPILSANSLPWINLKCSREKERMTSLSVWGCTGWEHFLGGSSQGQVLPPARGRNNKLSVWPLLVAAMSSWQPYVALRTRELRGCRTSSA